MRIPAGRVNFNKPSANDEDPDKPSSKMGMMKTESKN
jgi:hypothetical protein